MGVIIRKGGGLSGKICDVCGEWKMLIDFHSGAGFYKPYPDTLNIAVDKTLAFKKGEVIYLEAYVMQEQDTGAGVSVSIDAGQNVFTIDYIHDPKKKEVLEFFMPYDIFYNLPI